LHAPGSPSRGQRDRCGSAGAENLPLPWRHGVPRVEEREQPAIPAERVGAPQCCAAERSTWGGTMARPAPKLGLGREPSPREWLLDVLPRLPGKEVCR